MRADAIGVVCGGMAYAEVGVRPRGLRQKSVDRLRESGNRIDGKFAVPIFFGAVALTIAFLIFVP